MAQRENPTIESAGLSAMAWMAQRGLGVMATDGPAQGSNKNQLALV